MVTDKWSLREKAVLDEKQFDLWRQLLEARTGMQLAANSKSFLETSLNIRMREVGCAGFDDYYRKVMAGVSGEVEWATLVDRLTVQETRFFRHQHSFDLVADYCQQLLQQDRRSNIELWSVGCATGEETYSLAILMAELLQNNQQGQPPTKRQFGITGTDISMPALGKARAGEFPARRMTNLSQEHLARYFDDLGNSRFRAKQRLRDRVCFAQANVLDLARVPITDMDVAYCQNLLIYFSSPRKKAILDQVVERLRDGGLLVVGVGEVIDWKHPQMERIHFKDTLAFRRCGS